MPNHMIGLEYFAPYETVSTEEQLLEVFSDLKKCYSKLDSQFIMTDSNDVMITDFADFLEAATQEKSVVTLVGSGDIGGLKVENAVLTYDLSQVTEVTLYWD
ncbi:hypothetical protein GOV03_02690, partial [Candidatus Woesearchaeota archaeon]|nr:hypothetical protein [Candidatus Woesearchaeota archaeon]